jgi:hypothetical protein
MTAAEFSSYFDLICDKVGSPYFTSSEKSEFVNLAQFSVLDNLLFPLKEREQNRKNTDIFDFSYEYAMRQGMQPLFCSVTATITTSTTVTYTAIETAINTAYSITSSKVYKIVNIYLPEDVLAPTTYFSCKYVPTLNGSRAIYENLLFGGATSSNYGIYTNTNSSVSWIPALVNPDEIKIDCIRQPRAFSIATSQTVELDNIWHPEVLYRATQLAGIAMREADFYQMTNLEQTKEQ